jgi:hypothetical protein
VIVKNRPLEQWQIDHILKMQQELGSPQEASDVEEVTMDEELDGGTTGALPQAGDAVDAAGALSVYKDPNVLKAQTEYETLAKKQTDRYDALERAIAEKRYAPSFSERMFQLSAALAAPTSRRGFGGILENITPVLAAQEKARREGEISRREALEKLDADRLAQQVGLAKQGLSTSIALARLEAMANKTPSMKSVLIEDGKAYDPVSGENIVQPNDVAWADLASDPSQANYDDFVRQFGPRFAEKAMRIVNYARRGK